METRAAGECFHSFLEFSQTFTRVSITRYEHGEHMFSISFRKYRGEEKEKQLVNFDFCLFAPSLRQQLVLVLCFYRVIETRF